MPARVSRRWLMPLIWPLRGSDVSRDGSITSRLTSLPQGFYRYFCTAEPWFGWPLFLPAVK